MAANTPDRKGNGFVGDEDDIEMCASSSSSENLFTALEASVEQPPDIEDAVSVWQQSALTTWYAFMKKMKEGKLSVHEVGERVLNMDAVLMKLCKFATRNLYAVQELQDVVQVLYKQKDGVELSKEQVEERRGAHGTASPSPATEEDDKILLRGVKCERLKQLKDGDTDWLCSVGAWYRRSWQSPDGSWCVVVEINPHERGAILRGAKQLKAVEGIIITPYLTGWGMALRHARMAQFKALKEKGQSPKWYNGVGIRYTEDGVVKDYAF